MRLPAWLQGAIFADATWGMAVLFAYVFEAGERYFPKWLRDIDVPDTFGSIFSLIAFPIPLGGWLLIWGDNGRPFPWIESMPFNICFGICFYALIGASIGYLLARKWTTRFSSWKLLMAVAAFMFLLGTNAMLLESLF
jgi:hypothetical protein